MLFNIKSGVSKSSLNTFLIIVRFAALFAFAFALGYHAEGNLQGSASLPNAYPVLPSPNMKAFFVNVLYSSKAELIVTLCAVVSAFTFFCPLVLHSLIVMLGFIYGARSSYVISICGISPRALVFLLFSGIFSLIFIYFAARTQNANNSFLRTRKSSQKHLISVELKTYFIDCIKTFTIMAITRIICVILLSQT